MIMSARNTSPKLVISVDMKRGPRRWFIAERTSPKVIKELSNSTTYAIAKPTFETLGVEGGAVTSHDQRALTRSFTPDVTLESELDELVRAAQTEAASKNAQYFSLSNIVVRTTPEGNILEASYSAVNSRYRL